MKISHSRRSSGYGEYLETGRKAGRNETRDELDERIPLAGSLEELERVIEHTNETKNWKSAYVSTVISFSKEDEEKIKENPEYAEQLVRKTVQNLVGKGINIDENVTFYSEYHKPKLKHYLDENGEIILDENGEPKERLGHIHIGTALLSETLGKQLNIRNFEEAHDEAFQTLMNYKYGMTDPIERRAERARSSKAEGISRNRTGDDHTPSSDIPTDISDASLSDSRIYFADKMKDVNSVDEAVEIIKNDPFVKDFKLNLDRANKAIRVNLTNGHNINLRGRGFDNLVKAMYGKEGYEELVASGKFEPGKTPTGAWVDKAKKGKMTREEAEAWVERSDYKHYKKNRKLYGDACYDADLEAKLAERDGIKERNEPKDKKTEHGKKTEKKAHEFKSYYQNKSKEQRNYWRAFVGEIKKEIIDGCSIVGKDGNAKILNAEKGMFIRERGYHWTVEETKNVESRDRSIQIILQRAMQKDVDINRMQINGSKDFKKAVRSQIAEIVSNPDYKAPKNPKSGSITEIPAPKYNTVGKRGRGGKKPSRSNGLSAASKLAANAVGSGVTITSTEGSGGTVTITDEDDGFTIMQKLDAAWDKFWAKIKAENEAILEESARLQEENQQKTLKFIQQMATIAMGFPPFLIIPNFRPHTRVSSRDNTVAPTPKRTYKPRNAKVFVSPVNELATLSANIQEKTVEEALKKTRDINELKAVDANAVLDFAIKEYRLNPANFEVTEDNKIKDISTGTAPKSNIDFLMRTCAMKFSEAVDILDDIASAAAGGATHDQIISQVINEANKEMADDAYEDQVEDAVEYNEELAEDVQEHEAQEDALEATIDAQEAQAAHNLEEQNAQRHSETDLTWINENIDAKNEEYRVASIRERMEEFEANKHKSEEQRWVESLSESERKGFEKSAKDSGKTPEELVRQLGIEEAERRRQFAADRKDEHIKGGPSLDINK